jgi:hypothetical protein
MIPTNQSPRRSRLSTNDLGKFVLAGQMLPVTVEQLMYQFLGLEDLDALVLCSKICQREIILYIQQARYLRGEATTARIERMIVTHAKMLRVLPRMVDDANELKVLQNNRATLRVLNLDRMMEDGIFAMTGVKHHDSLLVAATCPQLSAFGCSDVYQMTDDEMRTRLKSIATNCTRLEHVHVRRHSCGSEVFLTTGLALKTLSLSINKAPLDVLKQLSAPNHAGLTTLGLGLGKPKLDVLTELANQLSQLPELTELKLTYFPLNNQNPSDLEMFRTINDETKRRVYVLPKLKLLNIESQPAQVGRQDCCLGLHHFGQFQTPSLVECVGITDVDDFQMLLDGSGESLRIIREIGCLAQIHRPDTDQTTIQSIMHSKVTSLSYLVAAKSLCLSVPVLRAMSKKWSQSLETLHAAIPVVTDPHVMRMILHEFPLLTVAFLDTTRKIEHKKRPEESLGSAFQRLARFYNVYDTTSSVAAEERGTEESRAGGGELESFFADLDGKDIIAPSLRILVLDLHLNSGSLFEKLRLPNLRVLHLDQSTTPPGERQSLDLATILQNASNLVTFQGRWCQFRCSQTKGFHHDKLRSVTIRDGEISCEHVNHLFDITTLSTLEFRGFPPEKYLTIIVDHPRQQTLEKIVLTYHWKSSNRPIDDLLLPCIRRFINQNRKETILQLPLSQTMIKQINMEFGPVFEDRRFCCICTEQGFVDQIAF